MGYCNFTDSLQLNAIRMYGTARRTKERSAPWGLSQVKPYDTLRERIDHAADAHPEQTSAATESDAELLVAQLAFIFVDAHQLVELSLTRGYRGHPRRRRQM